MAYIVEEIEYEPSGSGLDIDGKIEVLEKQQGEQMGHNQICSLEINSDACTPDDLVEIAVWLITTSNRILREYTPTGKKRKIN